MKKMVTSAAMLAVLSLGAVDTAQAQLRGDKAVYFTFSQPVALPKTTLPAGKYLFRLADSLANRQIVQVYSGDGARLEAMMMTLPVRRNDTPNDAEVRFLETPSDTPAAIATYWYPGERQGWEFIYPRSQANMLAKSSNQPVLTTASEATGDDMKSGSLVRVSPSGEQVSASDNIEASATKSDRDDQSDDVAVSASAQSSSGASAGNPRSTETAQSSQATPVGSAESARSSTTRQPRADVSADSAAKSETRTALPATASATPTILLAGVLALAGALWLTRRAAV